MVFEISWQPGFTCLASLVLEHKICRYLHILADLNLSTPPSHPPPCSYRRLTFVKICISLLPRFPIKLYCSTLNVAERGVIFKILTQPSENWAGKVSYIKYEDHAPLCIFPKSSEILQGISEIFWKTTPLNTGFRLFAKSSKLRKSSRLAQKFKKPRPSYSINYYGNLRVDKYT